MSEESPSKPHIEPHEAQLPITTDSMPLHGVTVKTNTQLAHEPDTVASLDTTQEQQQHNIDISQQNDTATSLQGQAISTPRQPDVLATPSDLKPPTSNYERSQSPDSDEALVQRTSRAQEKQRAVDSSSASDQAPDIVGLGIGDFSKASDLLSYEDYFPRGSDDPAVFDQAATAALQDRMPAPITGRKLVQELGESEHVPQFHENPHVDTAWTSVQADFLEEVAARGQEITGVDHRVCELRRIASNSDLCDFQEDHADLQATYEHLSTLNSMWLKDFTNAIPSTSRQKQPQLETRQQRQQAAESSNRKKRRDREREAAKQAKQDEVAQRAALSAQRRGKLRKLYSRSAKGQEESLLSTCPVEEIDKALWQGIYADMTKKMEQCHVAGDARGARTFHLCAHAARYLAAEASKNDSASETSAALAFRGFARTQAEFGVFSAELDALVRQGAEVSQLDPDILTPAHHAELRFQCALLLLFDQCDAPFPDSFAFHGSSGRVVAQPEDYLARGASERDVENKRRALRGEPPLVSSDEEYDQDAKRPESALSSSSQEVEQAVHVTEEETHAQQGQPDDAEGREEQKEEPTEAQREKKRKAVKRARAKAKQKRLAAERKEQEKEAARKTKQKVELEAARQRDREAKAARAQAMQASGAVAGQTEPVHEKREAVTAADTSESAVPVEAAQHPSAPSSPPPSLQPEFSEASPRAARTERGGAASPRPTSVDEEDPASVLMVSPKAGREGASSEPSTPLFSRRSSLSSDRPYISGMAAAAFEADFSFDDAEMDGAAIVAALEKEAERTAIRAPRLPNSRKGSLRRVRSDSCAFSELDIDIKSLTLNTPARAPAPAALSPHSGFRSPKPPLLRGLQPSSPDGDPSPLVLPTEYCTPAQRPREVGAPLDESPEAPSITILGSPSDAHEAEEEDGTEPDEQQPEESSGSSLHPHSTDTSSDGPDLGGARGRSAPARLTRRASMEYSQRTLSENDDDSDPYSDTAARYAQSAANNSEEEETDDDALETIAANQNRFADMFANGERHADFQIPHLDIRANVEIRGPAGEFAVLGLYDLSTGHRRGATPYEAKLHAGDAARFAEADDEDEGTNSDPDDLWDRSRQYGAMPRGESSYSVSQTTPGGSPESLRRSQRTLPERIYGQNYPDPMMDAMGQGADMQDRYGAAVTQGRFGPSHQAQAAYGLGMMGTRGGQERKTNLSAELQSIKDRLAAKGITARGYAPHGVSDDPAEQALLSLRGEREEPSSLWGGHWRDKPREKIYSNKPDVHSIVREEQIGADGKVHHQTRIIEEAPLRKHSGAEHRYLPRPKMARNLQSRQLGVRLPERERTEDRLRLMLGGASATGRERSLPWRTEPHQRVASAPEVREPSLGELELTFRQNITSSGAAGVEELD